MKMHMIFAGAENAYSIQTKKTFLCSEYYNDTQLLFLQKNINISSCVILKQIHTDNGLLIRSQDQIKDLVIRSVEGDFSITNQKNIGLALLTADCLPLLFYDAKKNVIAAAHAGWRGSVMRIAQKVVHNMVHVFGSQPEDIQVYFGPSAKVCCYEVSDIFYQNSLGDILFKKNCSKKNNTYFFDGVTYNKEQLLESGILASQLYFSDNICTICTPSYCSYRKDQKAPTRNVSVISLK